MQPGNVLLLSYQICGKNDETGTFVSGDARALEILRAALLSCELSTTPWQIGDLFR